MLVCLGWWLIGWQLAEIPHHIYLAHCTNSFLDVVSVVVVVVVVVRRECELFYIHLRMNEVQSE